jgi:two-component system KDP operon response regulator KdpE
MPKHFANVLAIDDEPLILRFLQYNLRLAGYTVFTAGNGTEGLNIVETTSLDLILLDLGLPDMDGLEVLRQLHRQSDVPTIIITARDDEESMVAGLNLGADDYLTKPFSGRALQARIEAVLRRYRTTTPRTTDKLQYSSGPLYVDVVTREVTLNGQNVSLTPVEFSLLAEFISAPGLVRLHSDLLSAVWGPEYRDDVTILRATIYRLRQKIEPNPAEPMFVRTEPGVGYVFSKPE